MVPLPPLDSPKPSFSLTHRRCAAKRGTGLGSVRFPAYMRLYCPEFPLRYPPRITVRGQTVQGGGVPLRKTLLRSRVYSWSTKRPCGPLAFRRATEGSRVLRKGRGVKRGRETLVSLPLLSLPGDPGIPGRRRRPLCTLRGHKVASSGTPLYRRNRFLSAEGIEESRRRRRALIPPHREAPSRRPPYPPGMPPHAHACRSLPPPECLPRTRPAPLPTRPPAPRARAPRSDRGTWS